MSKRMVCPTCWGSKYVSKKKCHKCQGIGTWEDIQLSTHFWLGEFLYSQTAIRRGIDNSLTSEHIGRLVILCDDILEPIREHFGPIKINSGYRSPALNKALSGSSSSSMHMESWAADIDPLNPRAKNKDIIDWVIASDLEYDQVIYEGTWVHLGRFSPKKTARKQKLMMFPDRNGKVKYYPYQPNDPRVVL